MYNTSSNIAIHMISIIIMFASINANYTILAVINCHSFIVSKFCIC